MQGPFARCVACHKARLLTDLLVFDGGHVCRPDRWLDDKMRGKVIREGFVREVGGDPCFRKINRQAIAQAVPETYRRLSDEYPIRPGTPGWDRLLEETGVTRTDSDDVAA